MSGKPLFSTVLLLTALGFGAARGQGPAVVGGTPLDSGTVPGGLIGGGSTGQPAGKTTEITESLPPVLPGYVTYNQPGCCGPLGGNGPIQEEVYVRSGISFPVAGHFFGHTLEPGWQVGAGGRSLLFNPELDAAWTLEAGLNNTRNQGQHSDITIPLNILLPGSTGPQPVSVTVKDLNRTWVNFGLGRELYLVGTACSPDTRWEAGVDVGVIYGSQRLELNEIRHRTSIIDGGYVAIHTDVEIPCCSVVFLAGVRLEYDYMHSTILQGQNDGNVQDINLLLTAGVRF